MKQIAPSSRAPLYDGVLERLRQMIIRCELQPGDRISEADLEQMFGVSRTPLREALKLLAAEGLVDIRPHRGAIVANIALDEVTETFDVMGALEMMAGPLVCERVSNIDLAILEAIVKEMDTLHAAGSLMKYFVINMKFHNYIISSTNNCVLSHIYSKMFGKIQRARYRVNYDAKRWQESVDEHHWIMEPLRTRDGEELGRRLKEHNARTAAAVMFELAVRDGENGEQHDVGQLDGSKNLAKLVDF